MYLVSLNYGTDFFRSLLASPCDADAQQPSKVWRIGEVAVGAPDRGAALAQEIEQGLADLGDVQGRNIVLTTQFVEPQVDKVQEGIISLLPQIDLLVTWSTIGGVAANGIRSRQ
jgi:hypothetical protein